MGAFEFAGTVFAWGQNQVSVPGRASDSDCPCQRGAADIPGLHSLIGPLALRGVTVVSSGCRQHSRGLSLPRLHKHCAPRCAIVQATV